MNFERPHVGFKIFRSQNDDMLGKLMNDSSIRKIVLFRSNVLANYSSAMIARDSHVWDVAKGDEVKQPPRIKFDERQFIVFHNNLIRYYRGVISSLNQNKQDFRFLRYDEINDPMALAMIINFIGADGNRAIDLENIKKLQVKQNTSDILQRFSNPELVEKFLAERNRLHWKYEGETSIAVIPRSATPESE